MSITQPGTELAPAPSPDWVLAKVSLEILSTDPARIESGEEFDEADDVGLLSRAWGGRVGRRYGVEQCP